MRVIVMWEWETVVVGTLVWYSMSMSMMKMTMTMTESYIDGYVTVDHSLSDSVIAVLE